MKKHHKIIIGSVSSVMVIFMVVFGILLNGFIITQTIENKNLKEEIKLLKDDTNKKITELAIDAIDTKHSIKTNLDSVTTQIDLLNADIQEDFSGIIKFIDPSINPKCL